MRIEQVSSIAISNQDKSEIYSEMNSSKTRVETMEAMSKRLEKELLKKQQLIKLLEKKCANNIFKSTEKLENRIQYLEKELFLHIQQRKDDLTVAKNSNQQKFAIQEKDELIHFLEKNIEKLQKKVSIQSKNLNEYQKLSKELLRQLNERNHKSSENSSYKEVRQNLSLEKQNLNQMNIPMGLRNVKRPQETKDQEVQTKIECSTIETQTIPNQLELQNQFLTQSLYQLQNEFLSKHEEVISLQKKLSTRNQIDKKQIRQYQQILQIFSIHPSDPDKKVKLMEEIKELKVNMKYMLEKFKKKQREYSETKKILLICQQELQCERAKTEWIQNQLEETKYLLENANQEIMRGKAIMLSYRLQ